MVFEIIKLWKSKYVSKIIYFQRIKIVSSKKRDYMNFSYQISNESKGLMDFQNDWYTEPSICHSHNKNFEIVKQTWVQTSLFLYATNIFFLCKHKKSHPSHTQKTISKQCFRLSSIKQKRSCCVLTFTANSLLIYFVSFYLNDKWKFAENSSCVRLCFCVNEKKTIAEFLRVLTVRVV